MKISFLLGIIVLLFSCTKENKNNRLFSGNWELEKITTINYSNNEVVSETDTTYYGVIQLQNGPDEVEGNEAYFTNFEPFPTDYCNWNVSSLKAKTITFYLWNIDLGINYSFTYNVDKISSRKMILSTYSSDNDLNLQQKVTLKFKKAH